MLGSANEYGIVRFSTLVLWISLPVSRAISHLARRLIHWRLCLDFSLALGYNTTLST